MLVYRDRIHHNSCTLEETFVRLPHREMGIKPWDGRGPGSCNMPWAACLYLCPWQMGPSATVLKAGLLGRMAGSSTGHPTPKDQFLEVLDLLPVVSRGSAAMA